MRRRTYSPLACVIGAVLLATACRREEIRSEQVAVPASWRVVDLGSFAFRFPTDRKIDGYDDLCGVAGPPNCVMFDEGPVLAYEAATFRLRTRDNYGDTGPASTQLGSSMTINGREVRRATSTNGTFTYSVTVGGSGPRTATKLGLEPDDALLWMTCRARRDCLLAEQIAGSVVFRSDGQLPRV